MSTTPTRPQSPLGLRDEERELLLQYEHQGVCGRFTQIVIRNIPLFLLLVVGILGLLAYFHPSLDALTKESCKMHHDELYGKLWLECPEALRRAFGPRHR